ncbi:unnamed protein product [Natator depressus]
MECDYPNCCYSGTNWWGSTSKVRVVAPWVVTIRLGGTAVKGLVDSGCGYTLVWEDQVRITDLDRHLLVHVSCVHGETSVYSMAEVGLEVQGQRARLQVGMVKDLPWHVILGRDWVGYSALTWKRPGQ